MINKKIFLAIIVLMLSFPTNVLARKINNNNNIYNNIKNSTNNTYIENDIFKVINISNNNILPINSLVVYNKKDNIKYKKIWSSAVILSNNNLLLGELLADKSYNYYELDKEGKQTFVININHYIKDINNAKNSFVTVENINGKYYSGLIDSEFNTIYDYIFIYKENMFFNDINILKVINNKYGIFSSSGDTLVLPIFSNIKEFAPNEYICIYNNKKYIIKNQNNIFINKTMLDNAPIWAKDNIKDAIELNFLSQELQMNLDKFISKAKMCELIINMYEKKTGFEIKIDKDDRFLGIHNKFILKAQKLGIISGQTGNIFDPKAKLTREEASVILANLIKKMEIKLDGSSIQFRDEKDISLWAKFSVQIVSASNIMIGDKDKYFHPKDYYTVAEAISTIMRIYALR